MCVIYIYTLAHAQWDQPMGLVISTLVSSSKHGAGACALPLSLYFGLIHSRTVLRMCNTATNQMARFAITSCSAHCAGVSRLSVHAIVSTHAHTERGAEPGSGEALLRSSIKGQNAACVESVCSLQRMQTKEKNDEETSSC